MSEKIKITIEVDKKYYEIANEVSEIVGLPLDVILNAKIHELALTKNTSFHLPSTIAVMTAKRLGIEKTVESLDDRFESDRRRLQARLEHSDEPDIYGDY